MANSLEQLINNLKNQVKEVAQNECKEIIRKTMQKHIDSDIYDKYDPTQYDRRDMDGGFIADENIDIDINSSNNGVNITATDIATGVDDAYGKPIIGIIETGIGYTWSHQPPARPFLERTAEELKGGKLEQALKNGLKKRGINTK